MPWVAPAATVPVLMRATPYSSFFPLHHSWSAWLLLAREPQIIRSGGRILDNFDGQVGGLDCAVFGGQHGLHLWSLVRTSSGLLRLAGKSRDHDFVPARRRSLFVL